MVLDVCGEGVNGRGVWIDQGSRGASVFVFGGQVTESFGAKLAGVGRVSRVDPGVRGQLVLSGKLPTAVVALKRFLTRVGQQVVVTLLLGDEFPAAKTVLETELFGVGLFVLVPGALANKRFAANGTEKGSGRLVVALDVIFVRVFARERGSTLGALERPLSRVGNLVMELHRGLHAKHFVALLTSPLQFTTAGLDLSGNATACRCGTAAAFSVLLRTAAATCRRM